jgi:hypothetical protein
VMPQLRTLTVTPPAPPEPVAAADARDVRALGF